MEVDYGEELCGDGIGEVVSDGVDVFRDGNGAGRVAEATGTWTAG